MVTKRKIAAVIGAAALAGGTVLVLNVGTASADEALTFDDARDMVEGTVSPDIMEAMQRDLGLDEAGVIDRLAIDRVTDKIEDVASERFAPDYAGTWTNESGDGTVVAITDPALTGDVEALGATATVVDRTLSDLESDVKALDAADAPDGVYTWSTDIMNNGIKVSAADKATGEAFLDAAGVAGTVDTNGAQPKPMEDIVGGTEYGIDGSALCSVGFSATHPEYGDGFLTAGHCGQTGSSVTSGTGEGGSFQFSEFPGSDYAWVQAGEGWTVSPQVADSDQTVADGSEAEVGSEVCRSGRTTGWHCGTILEKGVSVDYPEGTVSGMTHTDVCAEPGDSGGSYISGGSAQGVTSGGSGDCSSGGETFFYPLTDALAATGAELTTG